MANLSRDTQLYGAVCTIYFQANLANLTAIYAGGFIAGEVKISKDGAAFANTTNLPAYIAQGVYSLALTAAEMQATDVIITAINAGAEPICYPIRTKMNLSQLNIDATNIPTSGVNGTAVKLTASPAGTGAHAFLISGQGVGSGICAIGGATSGHGFYGVAGATSATGFNGGANSPGSKPSNFLSGELMEDINAVPTVGISSVSQVLASLAARFYNLVTQTSTQQKVFKADSVTAVATAAVSDDGVTQTKGRAV